MTQTTKETASQDIVEQLRKSANTIYEQDGYIFKLGLQNEAADEIERLREELNIRKLAIGSLVHAYDNDWKVGDAMIRARKVMADGYDPWVEIERLREDLDLTRKIARAEIDAKLRYAAALRKIADIEGGDIDVIWKEMRGIARAALKGNE